MGKDRVIIHVDMDAFYASVEIRDNPELAGKPLIIGALPSERGVVSTCSYEARVFGVCSGMSIKDAYRRCPDGIYMHPNGKKYKEASAQIHEIWSTYTDQVEYLSLDEGYLDVTDSIKMFGGAEKIGQEIKLRTQAETDLTCSVGIGYSMATAKFASEEKKPDGFFVVPDRDFFIQLIIDRDVTVITGVGKKTAEKMHFAGINTVRDIRKNEQKVMSMFGKHGHQIVELAQGFDTRKVTPYYEVEAKSMGREHTFQTDITDLTYLKSTLMMLAKELSMKMRTKGLYCQTITLKVTYYDMKAITRSKSGEATNRSEDYHRVAAAMLDQVEKRPIRLVGISLSNLTEDNSRQLTLEDIPRIETETKKAELDEKLLNLQLKYGADIIKTGTELEAEKCLEKEPD